MESRWSEEDVARIRRHTSIEDVIGEHVTLRRLHPGVNLKGDRCPFDQLAVSSFYVQPERGIYFCFACLANGDVLTFVQEFWRVDFDRAVAILAGRADPQADEPR